MNEKLRTSPAPVATAVDRAPMRSRRARHYFRDRLSWGGMYGTTSYARSALWIVPIVAIAIEIAAFPLLRRVDAWLGWQCPGLDGVGRKAMMQAVITFAQSFMVFMFGS